MEKCGYCGVQSRSLAVLASTDLIDQSRTARQTRYHSRLERNESKISRTTMRTNERAVTEKREESAAKSEIY